jgi:hypothetical protein
LSLGRMPVSDSDTGGHFWCLIGIRVGISGA